MSEGYIVSQLAGPIELKHQSQKQAPAGTIDDKMFLKRTTALVFDRPANAAKEWDTRSALLVSQVRQETFFIALLNDPLCVV